MTASELHIPERFQRVPYNAARHPGAGGVAGVDGGANCQHFAYELLRHFGHYLPPLRSSDLWDDATYTVRVDPPFKPLDLLLFNRRAESFGAHVALSLGGDEAIHLSQRVGVPAVWTIARFLAEPDYAVLIGAKRLLSEQTP